MSITGTINRVTATNQQLFLASIVVPGDATALNLANANPASFVPAGNTVVSLRSQVPGIFQVPTMTDTADASGRFSFANSTMEGLPSLSILVERVAGNVSVGGVQIPLLEPIYRSMPFNPVNLNSPVAIFVLDPPPLPPITQQMVDDAIAAATPGLPRAISSLSGRIQSGNRVYIVARGQAGPIAVRVKFDVRLRPVTSSNLARFVRGPIEDFEVDPFVAELCLPRADIDKAIRDMIASFNTAITSALRNSLPVVPGFDVSTFFARNVSVTCSDIDSPVVGTTMSSGFPLPIRQIEIEMRAGLPRSLA